MPNEYIGNGNFIGAGTISDAMGSIMYLKSLFVFLTLYFFLNIQVITGAEEHYSSIKSNTAPVEMDFAFIEGGCYMMGDVWGDGENDEKPAHEVCVDSFFLSKYEITQSQWELVMGDNPATFARGGNYPVENVNGDDISKFIKRLNRMSPDKYRLPTEAEWEYAAGAGENKIKYATRSGEISHDFCNYSGMGTNDKWNKTSPVGSFEPNSLGLFDMCGNVWELVEDSYNYSAYKQHAKNNPLYTGASSGRSARGCGWCDNEEDCRISIRDNVPQDCPLCSRRNDIGFRLVKNIDKSTAYIAQDSPILPSE